MKRPNSSRSVSDLIALVDSKRRRAELRQHPQPQIADQSFAERRHQRSVGVNPSRLGLTVDAPDHSHIHRSCFFSFRPQCDHRIYLRCPPRRDITG